MAYRLACWFMEVYGDWGFIPDPFILPVQEPAVDYAAVIAEKEAALEAQAAEIASLKDQVRTSEQVAKSTRQQRQQQSEQSAGSMDATEAEVRMIIDAQLKAAGWEADTNAIRYSKGVRPTKGRNLAIAEWPTDADDGGDGRVDYALFIGTQMVGMIEAKHPSKNVVAILDVQCKEYGTHVRAEDALLEHRALIRIGDQKPFGHQMDSELAGVNQVFFRLLLLPPCPVNNRQERTKHHPIRTGTAPKKTSGACSFYQIQSG